MKALLARILAATADGLLGLRNALLPPEALILELSTGPIASRCLYAAAELGIADRVSGGPASAADLARATGADPDALGRVLRVLEGLGVLVRDREGRFGLGRLGKPLKASDARSLAPWVRYTGVDWAWNDWGPFLDAVRTGATIHERQHGSGFFERNGQHPERQALFDAAMSSVTSAVAGAIADAYPFGSTDTVVDVGGGRGTLLAAILRAHPGIRGVLFDRPAVVESARRDGPLTAPELAPRADLKAGDLHDGPPPPGDVHVLKWIIHDWSDAQALAILKQCRTAARRLLLVEMLIEPGSRPSPAKNMDIAMLALTGGRERTRDEYGALLRAAGFDMTRTIPTTTPFWIVEAVPREAP